jgi:hypothetical protein
MVIGNRHELSASLFAPGYSMASLIANEFSEATSDLHVSALMAVRRWPVRRHADRQRDRALARVAHVADAGSLSVADDSLGRQNAASRARIAINWRRVRSERSPVASSRIISWSR